MLLLLRAVVRLYLMVVRSCRRLLLIRCSHRRRRRRLRLRLCGFFNTRVARPANDKTPRSQPDGRLLPDQEN